MFPVVADAVRHILEAALSDVAKPTRRVTLALQLVALAVKDRLTLTLAKLAQQLKVNTVIAEFLFYIDLPHHHAERFFCRLAHGFDGIVILLVFGGVEEAAEGLAGFVELAQ